MNYSVLTFRWTDVKSVFMNLDKWHAHRRILSVYSTKWPALRPPVQPKTRFSIPVLSYNFLQWKCNCGLSFSRIKTTLPEPNRKLFHFFFTLPSFFLVSILNRKPQKLSTANSIRFFFFARRAFIWAYCMLWIDNCYLWPHKPHSLICRIFSELPLCKCKEKKWAALEFASTEDTRWEWMKFASRKIHFE